MAWQGIEASEKKNDRIFGCTVLLIEKMNQINTKTIGNRKKRLCVRLRSGDKHHLRKSADRKAQIRKAFVPLTGLICAFRSADFLRWCLSPERNLTHNLFFLFPIVFGINNLIAHVTKYDSPQRHDLLVDILLSEGWCSSQSFTSRLCI